MPIARRRVDSAGPVGNGQNPGRCPQVLGQRAGKKRRRVAHTVNTPDDDSCFCFSCFFQKEKSRNHHQAAGWLRESPTPPRVDDGLPAGREPRRENRTAPEGELLEGGEGAVGELAARSRSASASTTASGSPRARRSSSARRRRTTSTSTADERRADAGVVSAACLDDVRQRDAHGHHARRRHALHHGARLASTFRLTTSPN